MTETDFFRMARERMGEYSLAVHRLPAAHKPPYAVTLLYGGQFYYGTGETLPEALADTARKAGIDRRSVPRDPTPPAPDGPPLLRPGH